MEQGRPAFASNATRNSSLRWVAYDEPLQWFWAPNKDYPPFQELVKIRDGS